MLFYVSQEESVFRTDISQNGCRWLLLTIGSIVNGAWIRDYFPAFESGMLRFRNNSLQCKRGLTWAPASVKHLSLPLGDRVRGSAATVPAARSLIFAVGRRIILRKALNITHEIIEGLRASRP